MKLAKTGQKIMPIWEKTTFLLYKNKVCEALKYIDDTCKKKDIWDKKYKAKASNFIFRLFTSMKYLNIYIITLFYYQISLILFYF
ncbi:MAG: hypothetical protein H0S78_10415 [Tissierellales bacterium]|nr:hypothetical protein [Tissierellales bacterium]